MFSEKALTKENIIAFLKEKGLYYECGEWCMPLYLKQEKEKADKKANQPVRERHFCWEGHYTRCCYESSGERFNDSSSWDIIVNNLELIPVNYSDPTDPECETAEGFVKLKDCKEFNKIRQRMMDFVNGDLDSDVDRCYDFDKYGFDNEPSEEQLTEWLGNLEFNPDDLKDIDPEEWFLGPSF